MSPSAPKTILVTGANKGLGLEAVRILSEHYPSSTILMGTRSIENGQAALEKLQSTSADSAHNYTNIIPFQLDVTSTSSITASVETIKSKYNKLDVLINNSGVATLNPNECLSVNFYGVHSMLEAYTPILTRGAKVITVASIVGAWALAEKNPELKSIFKNVDALTWPILESLAKDFVSDTPTHKWSKGAHDPYATSKTFVMALTRLFAAQHPEFKVACVCPGYCATDLNKFGGFRTAAQGGESITWLVLNDGWEHGGFYYDRKKVEYEGTMPADYMTTGGKI